MVSKKAKPNPANPRLGDLVSVEWLDAASFTNQPLTKAKPPKVTNIGVLVVDEDTHLTLRTGLYHDDGPDPDGDWTVIPKGWTEAVTVIKRGKQ